MSHPIDLYRFVTATQVWTVTNVDTGRLKDGITYNSEFYTPIAMGRGTIEQKREVAKQNLEIELPINHGISQYLLTTYSSEVFSLTVFTQRNLTTETSWKGRLASFKLDTNCIKLVFESVFSGLRRIGLRAAYQSSCRHALYGKGCNLAIESFATVASLTARSGNIVTVPSANLQADGYYTAGILRAPDDSLSYITNHVGTALTLQRITPVLLATLPLAVKIYPGCNHARLTCKNKFNNLVNYGGFDWIPQKSPMGGSSII
jgi:hypothetical protein